MKPKCPSCKSTTSIAAADLHVCTKCGTTYRSQPGIDPESISPELIANPPPGTWYTETEDGVHFGAHIRAGISTIALFPFSFATSCISLLLILGPISEARFEPFLLGLGLVFLLFGATSGYLAFFYMLGKNEVHVAENQLHYFGGVFGLGHKRSTPLNQIKDIYRSFTYEGSGRRHGRINFIVVESAESLTFSKGLNSQKMEFMLNALKYVVLTKDSPLAP